MIQCKCNLVGKLSAKENLTGKLNNAIVKEYPQLEDLEVTPSTEEQNFKSSKYGYNNVLLIPEIKEKIKVTNLEKYGCENPLSSHDIRRKCAKTLHSSGKIATSS